MNAETCPAEQGYRMPAEWEPHAATWLTWPHNPETWPGQDLKVIENVYLKMIAALHTGEQVCILAQNEAAQQQIEKDMVAHGIKLASIKIHVIPTNDSWIRDYGPNFLVKGMGEKKTVAANKWNFNSWGGKYEWERDNQAGNRIMENLGLPCFQPNIVLEGGAIEVNGQGVVITTEQCLLNPSRNPNMTRERMEALLKSHLDVKDVIWCQGEIEGDDTDGHIDNLVRFVNTDTVLCVYDDNEEDPNTACFQANWNTLNSYRTAAGKPLNVVRLPTPGRVELNGERLPASYANFYIGNRCVLLPIYGNKNDAMVESILKEYFPDREIVPIRSDVFVLGLGSFHCVTQQQPAGN